MGRGPEANAFPLGPVQSRNMWLHLLKTGGCQACHALGTPGMRHLPGMFMAKGDPVEAWRERLRSGGAMTQMAAGIARFDSERALNLFPQWTDRRRPRRRRIRTATRWGGARSRSGTAAR